MILMKFSMQGISGSIQLFLNNLPKIKHRAKLGHAGTKVIRSNVLSEPGHNDCMML